MKENINVSDLVASITEETNKKSALQKVASLTSKMKGSELSKHAEDAKAVAESVSAEIGMSSSPISMQLEKVASEMESASTVEEIIKIAESLDNSDLAHLSTIASKLADVVIADIQNKTQA